MIRKLTHIELEILNFILDGVSRKEIAYRTGKSEGYTSLRLHGIYQKLGVSSYRELMASLMDEKKKAKLLKEYS